MAEKTVNYTEAQAEEMAARYGAAQDTEAREAVVQDLAQELGKNVRSIRAKLVRLKVYVAKPRESKSGDKPETKEKIVSCIASQCHVNVAQLSGLEKATKAALNVIRAEFNLRGSDNA